LLNKKIIWYRCFEVDMNLVVIYNKEISKNNVMACMGFINDVEAEIEVALCKTFARKEKTMWS